MHKLVRGNSEGIIQFVIAKLGAFLLHIVKGRKDEVASFVHKWTRNGLRFGYDVCAVIMSLYWVVLTINPVPGFGSPLKIVVYLLNTFGCVLSVGIPALALNRLAIRWEPKHWLQR